jgi:hypothetical protein
MVTNYPQGLTVTRPAAVGAGEPSSVGLLARLFHGIRKLWCGFHGHDALLHFHDNRVALVCASCGYESPGWDVGQRRPRIRFHGDSRRHSLVLRPQPTLVRRKSA